MKIKIICIGKLKEKYWTEALKEYSKRLGAYADLEIIELKESPLLGSGQAAEDQVKREEAKTILTKISPGDYVISLEIKGKEMSSEELAKKINALTIEGKSEISFVIGGSLGLGEEVSKRADLKLSFSPMTFPHQMMRIILLEQIYRSFKIIRGETYHK